MTKKWGRRSCNRWKNDTCGEQDINLALFDGAGRRAGGPAIFLIELCVAREYAERSAKR